MMDKGIKQRLLGGVVLVAGAALFLPLLFDSSGAGLPLKQELPAKPKAPTVEELAPKLEKQAAGLNQAVDEAHADQTFYPVTPPPSVKEDAVSTPADEKFALTQPAAPAKPDASALQKDEKARAELAAKAAAEKATAEKLAADKAAEKAKQDKLEKAKQTDVAKQDAAKKQELARKQAEDEKKQAAQREAEQREAEMKVAQAKADAARAEKAKAEKNKSEALPEAWVVQVASLGAKDKADELVTKLRKKGFRALAHNSGGAWKVTVGPELKREVADSIKQKLANDPELKLSGWVQAYKP